jgi:hypothetical protein
MIHYEENTIYYHGNTIYFSSCKEECVSFNCGGMCECPEVA